MKQWFALKSKPRCELLVTQVLEQRGVEVYFPQVSVRPRRGRPDGPLEALFPGYLFSRLALQTPQWVAARSAPGVVAFLGAEGVPSPLPDELIDDIRTRVEGRKREGWRPPFKRGDRITIRGGPFRDLEAVFDEVVSPAGRVRVFLEVVRRLVPLELDADLLRRAG